jgi:hypothetical protein
MKIGFAEHPATSQNAQTALFGTMRLNDCLWFASLFSFAFVTIGIEIPGIPPLEGSEVLGGFGKRSSTAPFSWTARFFGDQKCHLQVLYPNLLVILFTMCDF